MEDRSKSRKGVSTWSGNLTHDIHTDGARLTDCEADFRTLIAGTEGLLDAGIGLSHCETTNMDGTIASDLDRTIGRDLELL